MTWATIHHIDGHLMAVDFAYSKRHKDAVAALTGAEWHKATKRWNLPVAALGDVVRIFWPNVTIDYAVLSARDEQIQRMFQQYMVMGIRFDVSAGKVVCDHPVLNEWFFDNSTTLHVSALSDAKKRGREPMGRARNVFNPQDGLDHCNDDKGPGKPVPLAHDEGIALWLRGVKGAVEREERKAEMLKRKAVYNRE